ncbi:MAG: TRAP transporter small permease [Alphaproteobacteria bacterium]|nr:TRAP transporter small permease [Alphaproteobacteria bacterium]MCB9930896.1 TRAP transporter small permease [Alphaproteobacteria bacterium]
MLQRLHGALEQISRIAVWCGGGALLAAAVMVTVDVLLRKFFSITMSGSDEISGYVFAAGTTWAYSYCLLHRSNVRIDAVYNFLPRPVKAVLDIVGVALLLGYMLLLTEKAVQMFVTSWENNSVSISTLAVPLWIPQLFWVAGLFLFVATLVVVTLHALVGLLTGDLDQVQRVAGVRSMEEEIEEETHGMGGPHTPATHAEGV